MSAFQTKYYKTDLCVIGGGLSGTIAAISAARNGAKVVLIQDRPVLGGNCSSEIRMWVRGAKGFGNKETGILSELEEENIYRNPNLSPSIWDSVLYGAVKAEKNITLLLNTSCMNAKQKDDQILSVTAWQLTTYSYHTVKAKIFADCSGDSVLSFLTTAKHRLGREGHAEYRETIGPEISDRKTMGMSLLLQARETDAPVKFTPPDWAYTYETDADFALAPSANGQYVADENGQLSTFRDHRIATSGTNLWWMEIGGNTGDPIGATEECRDELLKIAFGIWDHIKNKGNHGYENWDLEWVGFLPGKRESVRYIGDYVLTQNDIDANRDFPDAIAYGGWPMDDHNPKGFYANSKTDVPSILYQTPSPYQIPYRCLYSVNIKNLMFAGRNISATHAAMSSTRVMGTCSLLGQALGNAAALCIKKDISPKTVGTDCIQELQQIILDDGIMIPNKSRKLSELTQKATLDLPKSEQKILFDGVERPRLEGDRHYAILKKGDHISFSFKNEEKINDLRIAFDPDYSRGSITPNRKMQIFAQKLHTGKDFVPVKVANTIVKKFTVEADGKEVYKSVNNYHALITVPLHITVRELKITFHETWGNDEIHIFACDLK